MAALIVFEAFYTTLMDRYAHTMVILMIMYIFLMGHRIIPKHTLVKNIMSARREFKDTFTHS